MSSVPARHKKRKVRRTGQHRAPSKAPRAALGLAVPAVLAVGVIAATQLHAVDFSPAPVADDTPSKPAHFTQSALSGESQSGLPTTAASTRLAVAGPAKQINDIASAAAAATAAATTAAKTVAAAKSAATARKPAAKASVSQQPSATKSPTLACGPSNGPVPANYPAIVGFLTAHGYTAVAAAGIAGNIYQESQGNPESVGTGGGGLIGWTPLPAGFVTGNPAADLQTQLSAILTYNQQWAQYIPALNAATTPVQAADIYMNDFERPGLPAAANREAAAAAVAQACGIA